jgi:hypothetical protein
MQIRPRMKTLMLMGVLLLGCGTAPEKCHDVDVGGRFCVPDAGVAPAGRTLSFQVIDQCTGGCGHATIGCTVTRDAGTIALDITGQVCDPPPGTECALLCALTPMTCTLPALEPGDYTVTSPSQSPQTLHVEADAGVDSCTATFF